MRQEDIKNNVIRDSHNNIISANGFNIGDYVVFDRSLGGYSDAIFLIEEYFEHTLLGNTRSYIKYDGGMAPIDDFFYSGGFRKATKLEIQNY